jgi:hypothetical protein
VNDPLAFLTKAPYKLPVLITIGPDPAELARLPDSVGGIAELDAPVLLLQAKITD